MDRPADWDRIADLAKTMVLAPNQTIRPPARSGVMSVEGRAIAELAALSHATSGARLEVIGTLGEGGAPDRDEADPRGSLGRTGGTEGPEIPDSVPDEIRQVCVRAMQLKPEDRYQSVDAFRLAVRELLQHRGSVRLSEEAGRQLEVLRAAVAAVPEGSLKTHWEGVHRAFTEARFGFRQALASWSGNEVDMDLNIGRRTRLFVMGLLGILWIVYPMAVAVWGGEPELSDLFRAPAIFLAAVVALGIFARETLSKTLVNRRLFGVLVVVFVAQIILVAINAITGVPVEAHLVRLFFLWTLVSVFATLLVEWRLWPATLAQALGLVTVRWLPGHALGAIVGANLVFVANILIIWWPGSMRGTYDGDARLL
jgi:hypothetical protein